MALRADFDTGEPEALGRAGVGTKFGRHLVGLEGVPVERTSEAIVHARRVIEVPSIGIPSIIGNGTPGERIRDGHDHGLVDGQSPTSTGGVIFNSLVARALRNRVTFAVREPASA